MFGLFLFHKTINLGCQQRWEHVVLKHCVDAFKCLWESPETSSSQDQTDIALVFSHFYLLVAFCCF